jgi:hypothetical protein
VALHYADDTLLFSALDDGHLRNMKCILMLFERVSGMRVNSIRVSLFLLI